MSLLKKEKEEKKLFLNFHLPLFLVQNAVIFVSDPHPLPPFKTLHVTHECFFPKPLTGAENLCG